MWYVKDQWIKGQLIKDRLINAQRVFGIAITLLVLAGCQSVSSPDALVQRGGGDSGAPQPLVTEPTEENTAVAAATPARSQNTPFGPVPEDSLKLPERSYLAEAEGPAEQAQESADEPASTKAERDTFAKRLSAFLSNTLGALNETAPAFEDKQRVALLVPLSGAHQRVGESLMNAAQMAVTDANVEDLVLMPFDTKGTQQGATQAAQKAIESGARLILGPLFSGNAAAVANVAGREDIEVLAFTNDRFASKSGVFVMGHSPEPEIARVIAYAANQGKQDFAALLPDNAYGQHMRSVIQNILNYYNLNFVRFQFYDPAGNYAAPVKTLAEYDARVEAMEDERARVEAILATLSADVDEDISVEFSPLMNENAPDPFMAETLAEYKDWLAYYEELQEYETYGGLDYDALIMVETGQALRQIGPLLRYYDVEPEQVKILGISQWAAIQPWKDRAFRGAWLAGTPPKDVADFDARYTRIFGDNPPRIATLGYDGASLAASLAQKRGNGFVKPSLLQSNGFRGIDGIFRLTPNYLVQRGLAVLEVRSRGLKVIEAAPSSF